MKRSLQNYVVVLFLTFLISACFDRGSFRKTAFLNKFNRTLTGGSVQGPLVNYAGRVTTLAGSVGVSGSADGRGKAARFKFTEGITTDGTNLYLAEPLNHTIRKIEIATGSVTTLAGSAGVSGSADGTGKAARFNIPCDITTDGTNLYLAEWANHTIRKIEIATGAVTTLAGSAGVSGSADGIGKAARFNAPAGITTDGTALYLSSRADSSTARNIRKIVIATGDVTTLAVNADVGGPAEGSGKAARSSSFTGITTDGTNLYAMDSGDHTIQKIVIATGKATTLAGRSGVAGSVDGIGNAAMFSSFTGITMDGTNLYVTDYNNYTVRKVVIATGAVTTLAGKAGVAGLADGTGKAATFDKPYGITTDGKNLYVTDRHNFTIRRIQ